MKSRLLAHFMVGLLLGEIGLPELCAHPQAVSPPASSHESFSGLSSPQATSLQSASSQATSVKKQVDIYVEVPENTAFQVLTDRSLSTKHAREGMPLSFTLSNDVVVHNALIIPRGVTLYGRVVHSKRGRLAGGPEITLELTSLDLEGHSYPLYAYQFEVRGASKTPQTGTLVANGAFYGGLAGAVEAGKTGASTDTQKLADVAAGAAAGAGVATAVAMASGRSVIDIPAEAQLTFYLAAPIAVVPVSPKDAERINKEHPPGNAVLFLRGETP